MPFPPTEYERKLCLGKKRKRRSVHPLGAIGGGPLALFNKLADISGGGYGGEGGEIEGEGGE